VKSQPYVDDGRATPAWEREYEVQNWDDETRKIRTPAADMESIEFIRAISLNDQAKLVALEAKSSLVHIFELSYVTKSIFRVVLFDIKTSVCAIIGKRIDGSVLVIALYWIQDGRSATSRCCFI
jgi:hypothetical protein